jgi:hypothetical protein
MAAKIDGELGAAFNTFILDDLVPDPNADKSVLRAQRRSIFSWSSAWRDGHCAVRLLFLSE